MLKRTLILTVTAALAATTVVASGSAGAWGREGVPEMTARGGYDSGEEGGSEIVAYDAWRRQMVVTNGALNRIDIIDVRDVDDPTLTRSVDLSGVGSSVQSVATSNWWIAAAVAAHDPRDNGSVVLIDPFGGIRHTFEVGNLPDGLAFSANGRYLVVANEGEPICGNADGTVDKDDGEELLVDPEGTISIIDTWRKRVSTADFSKWIGKEDQLRRQGVRIFFPGSNAAQDLEPEYVAVSGNSTAYVTLQENNAVAVVDLRRAKVTKILPLGYKDHSLPGNGLDPSNEDGAEAIANYDVLGMYQPDAIATTNVGRATYFVTANEGDSREWGCFVEDSRVKDFDLGTAYDDALEVDELLGRLKTTSAFPTVFEGTQLDDGDELPADIEQVYSYGARSFSIWDQRGRQVFDSGDDFEQLLVGTPYFNLDEDETDGRSDDKGPEPEALAIGSVGRHTYAFIGLERSGGVMMYDITNPSRAKFVQYLNTETDLGDVSPEGIAFVPAWQSPTWKPLLLVSFEVSGTTRIIELG